MRKLFGANKKKKSSNLKTSTLKIPIPTINGVEYSNLPESQISTLIGGGNKDYHKKKLTTSLSSQRTNNTTQTEKTPSSIPVQHQPVTPSRSISSPPILVMPKPMHSLPPTRYILGNYDYEKTQVESSISSSDEEQEEEEEQIMSSPLSLTTAEKEVNEENNNHQSSTYVTRTSNDSMRHYISASESPFLTASSVVSSMNHQNNTDAPHFPPFSSPSSSTFVKYTSTGNDMNNIGNNVPRLVTSSSAPPPSTSIVTVAATNFNDMQEIPKPPSINSNEAVIQEFPLPPSNVYITEEINRNLPPISEYNNISTTPIPIPTKRRVSRPPTSSSGSSATVGHDVTHSQSRFVNNNSDKPPGALLQTISSEPSAFNQNNNNNRMDSLTELLQSEIKKMALNEDLVELKRTVDRMQQQRVSDLEDHLTRVAEQKIREKEILEQIKLTKQKLDMAIAERFFTNNNKEEEEEEEADQRLPKKPADIDVPLVKSSNSTNTTRSNKLKSNASISGGAASGSGNNNTNRQQQQQQQQPTINRQRNRRSFPSAYQRLPAQNEYFPDMSKPNFDFNYPPQYGYPQDYNPEIDMMRMMNGNQNHFADPFGMDSPRSHYSRRKSSLQHRPRSKSMESRWQEQQEQENQYIQQHHQHPDMYQDGDFYYPTPPSRSRKSSLRSAKSSSSDSDNNKNNKRSDLRDNFDQPPTTNEEEKRSASGRQPEMGSDEDRHHSARHHNGSGRFRRGHSHPGNMGNIPPNMFGYSNGPPPLPHPMDRERMKMRPPPPPPHYGYNNMPPPPPPGNEYFSYMPPSQRISPRMMAALAADEQNQQQPYSGYQWGQGMYGMPPPPPPDNGGTGANLPCEQQQDQPVFGNRRFPPPPPSAAGGQQQSAPLQQTPQPPSLPPPQGYMSMYGERIYM